MEERRRILDDLRRCCLSDEISILSREDFAELACSEISAGDKADIAPAKNGVVRFHNAIFGGREEDFRIVKVKLLGYSVILSKFTPKTYIMVVSRRPCQENDTLFGCINEARLHFEQQSRSVQGGQQHPPDQGGQEQPNQGEADEND